MDIIETQKTNNDSKSKLSHLDNEKDFHHYAYDEVENLIYLQKGKEYERKDYKCLACGEIMRPVMGNNREWHFRHKNCNPSCNFESYLHSLAKKLIKAKFDNEDEFYISYYIIESCPQIGHCAHCSPKCSRKSEHTINLKELYDTCQEEKTDGSSLYRADLKLSNSKNPKCKPIFIEVAYSHDCDTDKINSGIQIIEIKVYNEDDILQPLKEQQHMFIGEDSANPYQFCELPPVRFYNFERNVKLKSFKRKCFYAKAKKELMKRFEKSETFPITYKSFSECSLFGRCSLSSPECSQKIVDITKDLKVIYNRCSEDEKGNIVLSNTEKDVQPLTFKLSFDGQSGYEEGKYIIEFKQYNDVKNEIVEKELLHIDLSCSADPYKDAHRPTIRFYNFERSCKGEQSIQLRRYVVVRKDGKLFWGLLDSCQNISCKSEYERPKEVVYELLFPETNTSIINMYILGMIKARINRIMIKDCNLCQRCHNKSGGCQRYGNYMKNLLNVDGIDTQEEAMNCQHFACINPYRVLEYIMKRYRYIPLREWIRR
jgi:Competence protein CoiA-like family.